jgi:hypothetical protein
VNCFFFIFGSFFLVPFAGLPRGLLWSESSAILLLYQNIKEKQEATMFFSEAMARHGKKSFRHHGDFSTKSNAMAEKTACRFDI